MRDVAQTEGDADAVEIVIGEGQVFGVALCGGRWCAVVDHAVATDAQHGVVDVGEDDLTTAADLLQEQLGQIT